MGDARGIDHLRALALSSMPSLARRPGQRRKLGINDAVEQRKTLVSALAVSAADDKEEGELSSDDEIEHAATPLAAVESSFSFPHRNTGLSLRASPHEKVEKHTSAATSAGSVPLVGVTTASVFSSSTRVSINKPQLYSALTAQAPLLGSSEPPEPVQNGSGLGIAVRPDNHLFSEVNSSGALLDNFARNPYHGPSEKSLQAPSTLASQPIPTPLNLCRSHSSGKARTCKTPNSSSAGSARLQIRIPVPSTTLPSQRSPDLPIAVSAATRAVSAAPVSAISISGADVSIAVGAAPAVSHSATSGIGNPGRSDAGVRKEAEAFLASLRIPLSSSAASGNENEDAFLIKFDEDSESEGDNENRTIPSRRQQGRSSQKGTTTSAGLVTTSAPVLSNPASGTQSPADLTAEIDRVKKQIAAMERSKGKTLIPSFGGKASRVLPADINRNVLTSATESRPSTQSGAGTVRPASMDLESMRLRIAAKENELQQRRQQLAVKVPEIGRGVSDPKRTGCVLASSLPPTRSSQAADSVAAHAGNSIGKSSSEKGISGYRKEDQSRADGIPALALAGPVGATLASFKKDAEKRGSDGSRDHRHSNRLFSSFAASKLGSPVGRVSLQPASKGMKRSRLEDEGRDLAKAPRSDRTAASEMNLTEDSVKEATLPGNANDTLKGGSSLLSTVQTGKRKVEIAQMSSAKVVQGLPVDMIAAAGSGAVKKVKTNSGGLINSGQYDGKELLPNSKQFIAEHVSSHDTLLSTTLPKETMKSTFPSSDTSLKTGSTPGMVDGNVGIHDELPTVLLSAPLPVATERQRSSIVLTSSNVLPQFDTTGNTGALRLQPASRGMEISPMTFDDISLSAGLTQPIIKSSEFEQNAFGTTAAVTECQQATSGRLNQKNASSTENNRIQTTQAQKFVHLISSANLEYQVEDSFQAGHSSIDNHLLEGEQVAFQQLLEEEELLDKKLEEVQRIRQQCEIAERIARREYRESQWALRAANADCHALNQRKESLLSRIHAAEAAHLSGKSFLDRPVVPFRGTVVSHNQNKPGHPPLLVSAPYSHPVSQAVDGSWEEDVNVDRGRPALVCESLSPSSSERVDLAAFPPRHTVLSADVGEPNSHYKLARNLSSDGNGQESHGLLIAGVESSEGLENDGGAEEREVQAGFVDVGRQVDLEPQVLTDGVCEAENQCYSGSESDLRYDRSPDSPSANFNHSGPGVSDLPAKSQQNGASMVEESPHCTSLEVSMQVPVKNLSWITIDPSKQTAEVCSVDGICNGVSRMEGLSAVCQLDYRNPVPAQEPVPRLDSPKGTGRDLEGEGSGKDHHDFRKITSSHSSQDAQTVDSLRSGADLVHDLDTTEVPDSVTMEDVNVTVDDTIQDDSIGNVSRILVHVVPTHFKDSGSGVSGSELADADCQIEVGLPDFPDVVADSMAECACQVLPERSSSLQEALLLEKGSRAGESFPVSTRYTEDDLESESLLCSVSHNSLEESGGKGGFEQSNADSALEAPDSNVGLITEPQQSPTHLPPSAIDRLDKEEETNPNDGDNTQVKTSDARLLDVDASVLENSSSQEAPPHAHERKAQCVDESREEGVSAKLLHSDSTIGDPILPDLEMLHGRAMEHPERLPQVHLGTGDVESQNRASGEEHFPGVKPGSFVFRLQEEVDRGVLREDCVGGAESSEFIVQNFLAEQFPTTISHFGHDQLITEIEYGLPCSERRDDSVSVTELDDSRNLNMSGIRGGAHNLVEQHLDAFDVPPQSNLTVTFDDNSTSVGFDYRNEDPVQEGDTDICRPMPSEMITDNSEVSSQSEVASQDGSPAMAVVAEDEHQDQLHADMSESGDQNQEDSEKKERKGADVEVFRKALLDESMFERRSTSGEEAAATNLRKQNNEVSKQVLTQLQQHRLEHLLDMVEVRVPELSSGGGILIQERQQGERDAESPKAVDDLQLDALTVLCHDMVGPSSAQALSSGITSEHVSNTAKHWVPSAHCLVVLRFIPTVQPSEADSGWKMGRIPSERASFEAFLVPLHRYESPLSIFRSYTDLPLFFNNLHLSRRSVTWSHAINPFKPLCKFEHRGKCNNDDCPGQHADDYTLISDNNDRELATADSSLPTGDSPASATLVKARLAGPAEASLKPSTRPVSSPLNWNDSEVPIYRTGSYLLRAEDPMRTCLLSHNLQLDREVDSSHSFLLSPSIHRPLPSDVPCLLDASETPSWFWDAPAHPGAPHWRYVRDIEEKLMCSKDGLERQESIDEEMWLEVALHHIDYDLSTDNNKARDQALFYLSRALESKQSSVTLWVVYACLFHMRKDNPEKDDMFHHAVQYNPASYELWVLYINSRSDFQSSLEAYEKAIVALADEGTQQQLDKEDLSACLLDLGLQMLYFWCVCGCSEDSFLWVDDLICEASAKDYGRPHRGSTRALLSYLTQHDACVIWVACTYLLACKHLPNGIITRLGCRQELLDGLEWEKYAQLDELSRKRVVKALSTAASEGLGCLSLESAQTVVDKDNLSKQVLGVNYIQCLALYEGLDSAACLGKTLISLHPTSLELIVVCARIDEHRNGFTAGLHVFEQAVLQWPHDLPGMQRLWNQYAGHALLWGGKDMAKAVLFNCAATNKLSAIASGSQVSSGETETPDGERNAVEGWNHLREYFAMVSSVCKRNESRTNSSDQSPQVEDTVFALINLALVEALSGDLAASQSAINSALKAAISHQDLRHCWRELTAQYVLCTKSAGWGDSKFLEDGILSLLDRCKTDSHNLSQLRPLSQNAFQNCKKAHVRKFLEGLIGPPPLDHSVLNSILQTLYGPQMLPSGSSPLKEVFHFAEGILEATPGNVLVASSLCKIVKQNKSCLRRLYMPAVMWASALLISSLQQSCPVPPEVYWVEAGSLLRQLDEERSLEAFYKLAISRYPFSAALRHCLREVQDRMQVTEPLSPVVYNRSLDLVVAEPAQVAVEC